MYTDIYTRFLWSSKDWFRTERGKCCKQGVSVKFNTKINKTTKKFLNVMHKCDIVYTILRAQPKKYNIKECYNHEKRRTVSSLV